MLTHDEIMNIVYVKTLNREATIRFDKRKPITEPGKVVLVHTDAFGGDVEGDYDLFRAAPLLYSQLFKQFNYLQMIIEIAEATPGHVPLIEMMTSMQNAILTVLRVPTDGIAQVSKEIEQSHKVRKP